MTVLALLLVTSPAPPFDRGALDMYPVVEAERRAELYRAAMEPLGQADGLRKQAEQAKDPAERAKIDARIGEVYAAMEADLAAKGFDAARRDALAERLLERVRALPGVEQAALAPDLPLERGLNFPVDIAERPDLALGAAGTTWGLGHWWNRTGVVQKYPVLR